MPRNPELLSKHDRRDHESRSSSEVLRARLKLGAFLMRSCQDFVVLRSSDQLFRRFHPAHRAGSCSEAPLVSVEAARGQRSPLTRVRIPYGPYGVTKMSQNPHGYAGRL